MNLISFPARLAIMVSCLLLLMACSADEPEREVIVFVTIDTLRTDHLSLYGYPRNTSPFIDSLGERGLVFDRSYASIPTTTPSHASMFTSRYPIQHGVLKNGEKLRKTHTTLAQVFKRNGYNTAAFPSVQFMTASGLGKGFEFIDFPHRKNNENRQRKRPAEATVSATIRWLETDEGTQNLFLWVHLFDPHLPLRPPAEHLEFIKGLDDREAMREYLTETQKIDPSVYDSEEQMLNVIDKYDAEIRFADQQLGRLFEYVSSIPGNATWILTADHGEGLGTHQWKDHGSRLYNEQLQVPLIFFSESGRLLTGRTPVITDNVDLFPTFIDLFDLEAEVVADSYGCSLISYLRGGEQYCDKPFVLAQRRSYQSPRGEYEKGERYAVSAGDFKIIASIPGEIELFNVMRDPMEQTNLSDFPEWPQEALELKKAFGQRLEVLLENAAKRGEQVDDETLKTLQSLGYIQ